MKGAPCSDESTQLPSESAAPFGFRKLYSEFHLIVSPVQSATLLFWFTLTALIALFSEKKLYKATVHYLLSIKHQTDTASDQLANIVEYLAAKVPSIYLRRPKTELKESEDWI